VNWKFVSLIGGLCRESGVCVVNFGSLCRDSGVCVVSRGFVVAETGHRTKHLMLMPISGYRFRFAVKEQQTHTFP